MISGGIFGANPGTKFERILKVIHMKMPGRKTGETGVGVIVDRPGKIQKRIS